MEPASTTFPLCPLKGMVGNHLLIFNWISWVRERNICIGYSTPAGSGVAGVEAQWGSEGRWGSKPDPSHFFPQPCPLCLWSAFWTVFVADQFHLICLLISAIVILRRHAVLFIFISFRCFCLSYSGGLSSASGFAFRLECLSSCRCFECEIKRRWIPVKISFYEEKIGAYVNIPLTAPNELF